MNKFYFKLLTFVICFLSFVGETNATNIVVDTTPTVANTIDAVDDDYSATFLAPGGSTPTAVTINDKINGVAVVLGSASGQVSITGVTGNTNTLILNTLNGKVAVSPNAASGLYSISYTLCENGVSPQNCKTATVTVRVQNTISGVSSCSESTAGVNFSTAIDPDPTIYSYTFNAPSADYGFQFDIYTLDNSFNLKINGVNITTKEIQFQSGNNTLPQNVRFADGSNYGTGGIPNIYNITGSAATNPIIRVIINPDGSISLLGSKTNGGILQPLQLFGGNSFNPIIWNPTNSNTVVATQFVIGATYMTGFGSGLKAIACPILAVEDKAIPYTPGQTTPLPLVTNNDTLKDIPVTPGVGGNVTITDTTINGSPITINLDGTITVAVGTPPGEYPFSYTICETASIANCSSTTGSVIVAGVPSLTFDKKGTLNTNGTITYAFTVTNTGNVTISNVVIADGKIPTAIVLSKTTLAPGEFATGTASYTPTEAEIVAGKVFNQAKVIGDDPSGTPFGPVDSNDPNTPTPNDPTQVIVTKNPLLTFDKKGTLNTNGTITYAFTVTNTGNVTISNVVIADGKIPTAIVLSKTTLAPGEFATGTASYTPTEAEIVAGKVFNQAKVIGDDPSGTPFGPVDSNDPNTPTPNDPTQVIVTKNPLLTFDKKGTLNTNGTITYAFTVTNTGNVTISNVVIADGKIPTAIVLSKTTLAPGEFATGTASYTPTEAEIVAGKVFNQAKVIGDDPSGTPFGPVDSNDPNTPTPNDPTQVIVTKNPLLTFDKKGTLNTNGTITYAFTVTNTGNVTISNVAITDVKIPTAIVLSKTTLAPGEIATGTASYTPTEAEIVAGKVLNQATVGGKDPSGDQFGPVDSNDPNTPVPNDPTQVIVTKNPSLTFDKKGTLNTNGTITYAFTVTNTGNVTISNVAITDVKIPTAIVLSKTTLAPGEIATGTASYTPTEAEIVAGKVLNQATVGGKDPSGDQFGPVDSNDPNTPVPNDPTQVIVTKNPSLTFDKKGTLNTNGTITYAFTVTNTGNVTISNVAITDVKIPTAIVLSKSTLAPGEIATGTAIYTPTEAEIVAGKVLNQAKVGGKDPSGDSFGPVDSNDPNTPTPNDPTQVIVTKNPSLTFDKKGTLNTNGTITYAFTVTNTGNVTISNVAITDAKIPTAIVLSKSTLAPREIATGTAIYTPTEAEIVAGKVLNQAKVGGKDPSGDSFGPVDSNDPNTPTPNDPTQVIVIKNPSLTFDKKGTLNTNGTITYAFTVTNTGNVTISNVAITDAKIPTAIVLSKSTLAPGEIATGTAIYTPTEAEIVAGKVLNQAKVGGKDPSGDSFGPVDSNDPNTPTPNDPTQVIVIKNPSLTFDKKGTLNTNGTITYAFTVTNTGNVTISNVAITDAKIPTAIVLSKSTLAPGEIATGTAIYTPTEAEIVAGKVLNQAKVGGKDPSGDSFGPVDSNDPNTPTPNDPTQVIVIKNPSLTFDKKGTLNTNGTITYAFTVTNTGNVTISNVAITDAKIPTAIVLSKSTLAPGEIATGTAIYTPTEAEIVAGKVLNQAKVGGKDPSGDSFGPVDSNDPNTPTPNDPTQVIVIKNPSLTFDKKGTLNTNGTITYAFTVTNTGNVTISNVAITDAKIPTAIVLSKSTLAPGEIATGTAIYTPTEAEIVAGKVLNQAKVGGKDPSGDSFGPVDSNDPNTPTPNDPTQVIVIKNPSLTFDKKGTLNTNGTITYAFTVTNTGNVTISNVAITDAKIPTAIVLSKSTLAPGEIATGTAIYTPTEAEIVAGKVLNQAKVGGKDPSGDSFGPVDSNDPNTPTPNDPTQVIVNINPSLSITKDGAYTDTNKDGIANVGDVINYTFEVKNTGNVKLTGVMVMDENAVVTGEPITLSVGDTTTFKASHTITQADLDSGIVYNLATATGKDPKGNDVTDTSSDPTPCTTCPVNPECVDCTIVTLDQKPSIAVVKQVVFDDNNNDGIAQVGETITYSFTITNTGNVSLSNITINDPLPGILMTGGPIQLGVGEVDTASFTGVYTLSQADINAGSVSNQAVVTGTSTTNVTVTDNSDDTDNLGDNPTVLGIVGCEIKVFNGLSPDGDDINDFLYISGIECYPNNQLMIFNRWGVQVFDAKGYDNKTKVFKGISEGRTTINQSEALPAGTYFYILQYSNNEGTTKEKQGYLYINL